MKTQESIRILLSLYVTLLQNFQALIYYEKYLSEESENLNKIDLPSRNEDCIDEAIYESLWFQIILKACSFLEEWDGFLAVKTNEEDQNKLLLIKKAVAPARKEINKWKDLKKFRNEIIAHNLRNNQKQFSLDDLEKYDCPNTNYELYYLVAFLERMAMVVSKNYPNETHNIISLAENAVAHSKRSSEGKIPEKELKKAYNQMNKNIDNNIWSIVRFDIIKANYDAIQKDYIDNIKNAE